MRILIIEDSPLFQMKILQGINNATDRFLKKYNQEPQTEIMIISTIADAIKFLGNGFEAPINNIIFSDYNLPDGSTTKIWDNINTSYLDNSLLVAISRLEFNNQKILNSISWSNSRTIKLSFIKDNNFVQRVEDIVYRGMESIDYFDGEKCLWLKQETIECK